MTNRSIGWSVPRETRTTGFPSPRWGGARGGVNMQGHPYFFTPTPDPSPQGGGEDARLTLGSTFSERGGYAND